MSQSRPGPARPTGIARTRPVLARGRRPLAAATATLLAVAGLTVLQGAAAGSARAAAFGDGDLVVVRVGSGTGTLASAAAPVFLDEYGPSGTLVQSVPLPTATAAGAAPLTLSGSATSEGALALSTDGRYLTLAGYGAAPGTAAVASTSASTVPRVVARVGADGAIDTSTALADAHTGSTVRGAVTDDGSRFWTTGGAGGVRLASLGATTSASVSGGTTVANFRVPVIAGGQLHVSSASGAAAGVNRVGTGLPTTSSGLTPLLSPAPASPYGFVLLDRSAAVPGVDTLYVADDTSGTGGILKYSTSDGTTWTAQGSFRPAGESARGLAGSVRPDGSVRLAATTATSTSLVAVTDTAAFDAPFAGSGTTLVAPAPNTVLRGVALAPAGTPTVPPAALAITAQPQGTTVTSGATATLTVVATGTAPLTYQWYQGATGDTSTPVGTGAATLTTPARTATTSYWVRVGDATGSVDSATATVTVTGTPPVACSGDDVTIGAVQGTTDTSPAVGRTVTVQGTVVGDDEGASPALGGFFLQDGGDGDPATSDGVFVFNNLGGTRPDSVSVGQVVQVTGSVSEFQGQTQVTATSIEQCGTTGTVTPTDVTLPRAAAGDLERFEGMLVRFPQTLTVTENFQLGRFGQVVVSGGGRLRQPTSLYPAADPRAAALQAANDLDRLIVDDGDNAQNPDPIVFGRDGAPLAAGNTLRGGDTLTDPVGVLTYTWAGNAASGNAYRLRPVNTLGGSARFVDGNPRPTAPPAVGGTLKVASANLLNFFNTFTGCTNGVGGPATDCRGAENAVEYQRQLAKEVAALTSLRADVIGVMELENDGYGDGSAIRALVEALNAADGAGTWSFVDPDAATGVVNAAGTDAIKPALLYRTAAATPVPGLTFTDTAAGVFERNPVAQTFRAADGGVVTVVANHFKSKGSCPAAGDPNADRGDGQGCWNARRTAQATELARWLAATVVPAAATPDVVIVGDLNSYAQEDPVRALEAAGYVNLPATFHGADAYSYVFDGQVGYLDHVLASATLLPRATGAEDVHINADEPSVLDYNTDFKTAGQVASLYAPDRFRTSDHDPVVAGFDVGVPAGFTGSPAMSLTTGTPYTVTFTPSGTGTAVFSVPSGTLPTGLTLSGGGTLAGTPTADGTYPFTVRALNAYGSQDRTFTITVGTAAGFTGTPPAALTVGAPVSFAFTPTGTAPVTFTVSSGTLPAGVALSAAGTLSGTPTATGTASFTVTAANDYGSTARPFTLTTGKAASITTIRSSAPDALYRGAVSWTATVTPSTVSGAPVPTGTVQFSVGGVRLGAPVPLVHGTATSPVTTSLRPGATAVTAVYSGDAAVTGSQATYSQPVTFAVTVVSPVAGASYRAGSIVPVRYRLTDAVGRVPDLVAGEWLLTCRTKVSAGGVQTLAPTCPILYDPISDLFTVAWPTARRGGTGSVAVSVAVTYPGLTSPRTTTIPIRLTT